jgi:outer membrane beta-barrel protein
MRNLQWLVAVLVMAGSVAKADDEPQARIKNGSDESIYVVQPRSFSKKHKFELTPMFFTALNPRFVGYVGGGLSAVYHVRENMAVEISSSVPGGLYSYYSNMVGDIYAYQGLVPPVVDLKHMRYFGTADVQLSALYGKFRFSIFSFSTLIDYDAYITAGLGATKTMESCAAGRNGCSEVVGAGRGLRNPTDTVDRWKLAGTVGGGMRFFFSDHVGLRFEIRDIAYSDRGKDDRDVVSTDIRNNLLFFSGLSFLI